MIPATAHFIWFGRALPWVHVLALRSAARCGGFERLIFHHADDLSGTRWWAELVAVPGIETRRLDAEALLGRVAPAALGDALRTLLGRLEQPAARANVVRAAILAGEGGVYLDLDTVTVGDLTPLRVGAGVFCGRERLVFPAAVVDSKNPLVWGAAGVRTAIRDLCRRAPQGWRAFRRIERLYPTAVNNAVLGAEASHPFMAELLRRMVATPPELQTARFALGTRLLEAATGAWPGGDLIVHPPGVFYPLGPEISQHWFRRTQRPDLAAALGACRDHGPRDGVAACSDRIPGSEARVVHWYASVRTHALVPRIDPDYVRAHATRQLFSALALPFV